MDKKRSYTILERDLETPERLDWFCIKIGTEYATFPDEFSRSYFTKTYAITSQCFYKVLERSVTHNLVKMSIVVQMYKKASRNSNRNIGIQGTNNRRTQIKYARLFQMRMQYIARTLPREQKLKVTVYVAEHPQMCLAECARELGIQKSLMLYMMEDAIESNIVDDQIFEAIKQRQGNNTSSDKTISFFRQLEEKRKLQKKTAK